jgi:large subunit ribosomal protein L7/L12
MSNEILCPHCKKLLRWDPQMAGRTVRCPFCEGMLKYPTSLPEVAAGEGHMTCYHILLRSPGTARVKVIKLVGEQMGFGLTEARSIVDNCPLSIAAYRDYQKAYEVKAKFENLGAEVEVTTIDKGEDRLIDMVNRGLSAAEQYRPGSFRASEAEQHFGPCKSALRTLGTLGTERAIDTITGIIRYCKKDGYHYSGILQVARESLIKSTSPYAKLSLALIRRETEKVKELVMQYPFLRPKVDEFD